MEADHPFIVNRIRALAHFYKSAQYQTIKNRLGEGGTSILQQPVMGTMHLLDKIVDKYHPNAQVRQYNVLHQLQTPLSNVTSQYNPNQPQPAVQSTPQMNHGIQPVVTHSEYVQQAQSVSQVQATVPICPACQQQNRMDSVYCFACGTKLK